MSTAAAADVAATDDPLPPEVRERAEKAKKKIDYPQHKFAALFPPSNSTDFGQLKESIRAHGVEKKAVLARDPDGKDWGILEGNTRARAVKELYDEGVFETPAGKPIELEFDKLDSTDALDLLHFSETSNVHRNLSPNQRAAIAVRLEGAEDAVLRARGEKRKFKNDDGTERNEKYEDKWDRLHRTSKANKLYLQNCLHLWKNRQYDLIDLIANGTMRVKEATAVYARREKGLPDQPTEEEAKKAARKVPGALTDDNEEEVPDRLEPVFIANEGVEKTLSLLRKARKEIVAVFDGPAGGDMNRDVILDALALASREIGQGKTGMICANCKGKEKWKGGVCPVCKGAGAMSARQKKSGIDSGLITA